MRWFALDEWNWETQLTVPELCERLTRDVGVVRLGSFIHQKEFVGTASKTGFHLTPVIWGQTSLLPQFVGEWRPAASGSQVKVIVVPNRAVHVCLIILFACLSTLVYDPKLERVALLTIGSSALGWLWLQGSALIGTSIAERKLRRLLEANPTRNAEPWPLSAPRATRAAIAICIVTAITLVIGVTLIVLIYEGALAFSNRPAVDLVCVYWTTQAIAIAWLFCLSKLKPAAMVRCLTLLFGLEVGITWCLAVDGYAGDGRPLLTWRWSPTRAKTFAATQAPHIPPTNTLVDLTVTGPHDFSGFRGSRRNGVVAEIQLDPDWQKTAPQVVWQHPIGAGWSAFAVVAGFAVTQEQRGENEAVV
ncbi:MAG: repeat-like protein, partial [Planctomycetaceae bacterium]|nr:repeat-like protein [Planctomycetaceae bacterium]